MAPVGQPDVPPEGVRNEIKGDVHGSWVVQIGQASFFAGERLRGVDPGSWPLASSWEPLTSGVHRARELSSRDHVPPYVERDVDLDLRAKIADAGERGGWVLLLGHSAAGKTRAAFEAIRAALPEHRVATPTTGEDLRPILAAVVSSDVRCVLWLDDLDESFLNPGGLDPNLLTEFVRVRVAVVATMRIQRLKVFTPIGRETGSSSAAQAVRVGARVLEMAEAVEIRRTWSANELQRAAEFRDERIVEAVAHHGPYGVAEYLAAGPAIWSEWRRAIDVEGQPRGAALVAAAVDLARCGLPGPYSYDLITELHEHYLEAQGGHILRPEPLPDAWTWASGRRYGVTSPLIPASATHWKVFDYLVDGTERLSPTPVVPDLVWTRAVEHATDDQLMNIAINAAQAGTPVSLQVAEAVWRPMVSDDPDGGLAAYNLGVLYNETGRLDEARELYVRAAHAGVPPAAHNLSALCADAGEASEARKWLREAARMNHPPAFFTLGFELEEQGKIDEAETWYRRGAELGEHRAATNLGKILSNAGRVDEALPWFVIANEAGDRYAAFNIGIFHEEAGRLDRAEHWYHVALERGTAEAAVCLGDVRLKLEDAVGAEKWFKHAAEAGVARAFGKLGRLLTASGRLAEAEDWFRLGADGGDVVSIRGMGFVLHESGRLEEAVAWMERGAALDDRSSTEVLGQLLYDLDRIDEAIPHLEKAANEGAGNSAFNLGVIHARAGDLTEAARWYRRAADGGDSEAAMNLADVLFRDGKVASAVWWVRRSRQLGPAARRSIDG